MTDDECKIAKEAFGKIIVADTMLSKALEAVSIAASVCSDAHTAAIKHGNETLVENTHSLLRQIVEVEKQVSKLSIDSRMLYRSVQVAKT